MKVLWSWLLVLAVSKIALAFGPTGFPFQNESLHYTINWPSGLSLGDISLSAQYTGDQWDLEMTLSAGFPGFPIADRFHSGNNADQCSSLFERNLSQGSKKSSEKTTFDYRQGRAFRETQGGGKSEVTIGSCARDALAFLYFARRELGQGRVPPQQDIFFGAVYSARLEYTGAQDIKVGDAKPVVSDRVAVTLRGPVANVNFEMFFARDPARTPLVVRVPSSLGTLSLELVQ